MKFSLYRLVAAFTAILWATSVYAQQPPSRPQRPYRGLFGGGIGETEQLLTASVSMGGGYDDNILAEATGSGIGVGGTDPRTAQSGGYGMLSAELSYSLNRPRVNFAGSVGTASRYYPQMEQNFVGSHSGSAGVSVQVSKRLRVGAHQGVAYIPYNVLPMFPSLFDPQLGRIVTPEQDLGARREEYVAHMSNADMSYELWRGAAVSASYGRQTSNASNQQTFTSQTAAGAFTQGLIKGLSLRLGYGYQEASYPGTETKPFVVHSINAGVDYNRALSFTRRTTLAFGTGSAAVVEPQTDRLHYKFLGNARLNREIGRTWNATLAYSRNLDFVERFQAPFIYDSITFGVGGLISRRLQFDSMIGAALGHVGLDAQSNNYDTIYGTVGLSTALSRHLAVGVNYAYYRYTFETSAFLPSGLAPQMDRQSVRVYLQVWAPLVHRARRPNASR